MSTTDRTDDPGPASARNSGGDPATTRAATARLLIRPYAGKPFALRGIVDGREAYVETLDAAIVVDEVLYERARQLVEQGARFELPDYQRSYVAAVEGDEPAVALTFLRSFDRVVSVRMSLDAG